MDIIQEIALIGKNELKWAIRIEFLLKEIKPTKEVNNDCLTLIWGDTMFFGALLSARSTFFPEETLVKDRKLNEVILMGKIEAPKHQHVLQGIYASIGDPTGHLELPNLSSHNWIHDDIEVSSNFNTVSNTLKIIIRKPL